MKKNLAAAFFALSVVFSAKASVLTIADVPIAANGENTVVAREAALQSGQVEAFNRLLQQMVASDDLVNVTPATSEQLIDMVRDVSVSNEKTTATKYMGSMTVRFKTAAVKSFLKEQDVPFKAALPEPFLIVPIYQNEMGAVGIEEHNPFFGALQSMTPKSAVYQFRVPAGELDEVTAVNTVMANQKALALHPVLQRYGVRRALFVSIAQSGTQYRIKTYMYPAERLPEAEVDFTVTDDRSNQVAVARDLMADMVRYMDKQWNQKQQNRTATKETIQAVIPLKSVAEMGRLQKEVRRIRGVEHATVKGIQNKQLLVDLTFTGDVDTLPERITGPFVLKKDGNTYVLSEKGAENVVESE